MIIPLQDWDASGIEVRRDGGTVDVIAADPDERVVLDLHIGEIRYNLGPDSGQEVGDEPFITIAPGSAARIDTAERFTIGPKVFGQICSRASLTNRGLVVSNIKVDPKFHGRLTITVYNVGPDRIRLARSRPFCSIFFQYISQEIVGPDRTPPPPPPRQYGRTKTFFQRHSRVIVTALISLVVSISGSLISTSIDSPSTAAPTNHGGASPNSTR